MTTPTPDNAHPACTHCGGTNIVRAVHVGKTAEVGHVGLGYQTAFLLGGTEPLVADLCDACGTVVRLYVRNVGRRWNAE